jgi:NTE family protein
MATRKAAPRRRNTPRAAPSRSKVKVVNLALQGGGSHGAYAWGILDRFLEDGRLAIEGISGTSAGSMNAVAYAYGRLLGGPEGARQKLHDFWKAMSDAGRAFNLGARLPGGTFLGGADSSPVFEAFKMVTGSFSPYQWNPLNINPLRQVLEAQVDFERLRTCRVTKLFIAATSVHTGKARVFSTPEVTSDVVLASACLPNVFQAVEIDGEPFWDGGYMGNPVLYPLFYETESRDVIIVHINPIHRAGTPKLAHEIEDRMNEITFNASLIKELRAIAFVQKLLNDGWIKEEYRKNLKNVLLHSVRADHALKGLSVASKFDTDWTFLQDLRERGRATAQTWLERHFDQLGERSSVDIRKEFL